MMGRAAKSRRLAASADALTTCTYCPSLCRHACPVATVEARDTVSPWGLVSLVDHIRRGRVDLDEETAAILYACNGCRACTSFCVHSVDVAEILVSARANAVERGLTPIPEATFDECRQPLAESVLSRRASGASFETRPTLSLVPGRKTLTHTPEVVGQLLSLCEKLEVDLIGLSDAALLDVGYDLWFAGFHDAFLTQAKKVHAALASAAEVVVMSPEALYCLKHIYPRFGLAIDADLVHTSEFVLPLISGAPVDRLSVRVAYQESCHLARHLGGSTAPREVLARVLEQPASELAYHHGETLCCGATGCLPTTRPESASAMATTIIDLAVDAGVERIVSASPECVAALRLVAAGRVAVDHVLTLVAEAVADDGAGK